MSDTPAAPPSSAAISEAAAAALLDWYGAMGVDTFVGEAPRDHFAALPEPARKTKPKPAGPTTQAQRSSGVAASAQAQQAREAEAVESAHALALKADSLEALKNAVARFDGIAMKKTAQNLVFADGNPEAQVMIIGEGPGAEEDRQGLPFVGRSGQLLDRILSAVGLSRESVYITNVLNWRPPGNRTPEPFEIRASWAFLERHVELVAPKIIVAVGNTAAHQVLGSHEPMKRLRGRIRNVHIGKHECAAMATYHPAYLLRTPAQKGLVWRDMLQIEQWLAEHAA